jgi:adenylate cyclase
VVAPYTGRWHCCVAHGIRSRVARLIFHPGKSDEEVFDLVDGANNIGRTNDNHVFVLHESLSRSHARLSLTANGVTIEDLGSKNGTFVDGIRITKHTLRGASYIKCGDVVFSFVPEGGSLPLARSATAQQTPTLVCDTDPLRRPLDQLLGDKSETAAADKLQILLRVSELLSSPAPIDEVLARILDLVFEILDVDRGVILMLDEAGVPVPRVSKTRPGVDAKHSRQIVSYVLERGVAALFADTKSDPRLAEGGSIVAQSICASMCAPLKPRDRMLGVLYVDNLTRPDRFQQEDLAFLLAFANQAAIAIDNALLSAKLAEEAVARNNLVRFFPPAAIEAIMHSGGSLEPIETEATVLFSDISGFTALSAELSPRDIIALLNGYFPVMADIVFKHEGTLEKYIGDALLAVWGAPFSRPDDAVRTVRAAIDMQRAMHRLNEQFALSSELRIHIGINSGIVAAGNIGSAHYLQYATVGDATNVAARVCGVAKEREILIDARTAERLPSGSFTLGALAPVNVKGKVDPLQLFRVDWQ